MRPSNDKEDSAMSGAKRNPSTSSATPPGADDAATVPSLPVDSKLPLESLKDPRENASAKVAKPRKKAGRNTESFDPASTLVRPDIRVRVSLPTAKGFNAPLKHDDVVIVPQLFGDEEDWSVYYKLVEEMTQLQKDNVHGSDWISWHEGAHLIAKNPKGSKTFNEVIDKLCAYFNIRKTSVGTRFNWYKNGHDWKPFHHDSAAFNPDRAKNQNITVGVSFGTTRELAFLNATDTSKSANPCRLYFPQTNNGVFTFGRDVNIRWKHGINALPEEERTEKGRISIILWGLAQDVIEEEGSPPMLGADGKGPHAAQSWKKNGARRGNINNNTSGNGNGGGRGRNRNRNRNGKGNANKANTDASNSKNAKQRNGAKNSDHQQQKQQQQQRE